LARYDFGSNGTLDMPLNNKQKQIILKTNSKSRTWLTLISGLTGFTEREMDVLEVIIQKREELVANGIKQPYLSELLFSSSSRKEYQEKLGITQFNFTNLLGSIRNKRGLSMTNEVEDIDDRLLPANEMIIRFVQNDTRTTTDKEDSETTESGRTES
jgi:hypothetical protein